MFAMADVMLAKRRQDADNLAMVNSQLTEATAGKVVWIDPAQWRRDCLAYRGF